MKLPRVALSDAIFAIVPIKPLDEGKSRLTPLLGPAKRRKLNAFLMQQTFSKAEAFPGPTRTIVVSPSSEVLASAAARGFVPVRQKGKGLNNALAEATQQAMQLGATSAFILPVDLPMVRSEDLKTTIIGIGRNACALAPDRRRLGTNWLYLSPVQDTLYRFGPNSFQRHLRQAELCGLDLRVVEDDRFAFDIDRPDDYRRWKSLDAESFYDGE
jgi:2-phospho-L-lactate/phosphoenolpyruvate guanylyltransferase